MSSRRLVAVAVALLLSSVPCPAAPTTPLRDPAGDPLPQGAWCASAPRLRHTNSVINVAFAPDGKSLASCDNDGIVRLWDDGYRQGHPPLRGAPGSVNGLAFSPDGKTLLSAGPTAPPASGTWRPPRSASSPGHRGTLTAAFVARTARPSPPRAARRHRPALGRGHRGKELHIFKVARDTGSPTWPSRPTARRWRSSAPTSAWSCSTPPPADEVQTFAGHGEPLNSLDFSRDGKVLASAGGDGLAPLWDVADRQGAAPARGHDGLVSSVHFSPDGKLIATGGDDRRPHLGRGDRPGAAPLQRPPRRVVLELAFSPDGKVLASASRDQTVRLWDMATGKELPQSAGPGPVACAALSRRRQAGGDRAPGRRRSPLGPGDGQAAGRAGLDFDGPVTALALSPDGNLIAAGNGAGTFRRVGRGHRARSGSRDEEKRPSCRGRTDAVTAPCRRTARRWPSVRNEAGGGVNFL